jgi:hypothetical protein
MQRPRVATNVRNAGANRRRKQRRLLWLQCPADPDRRYSGLLEFAKSVKIELAINMKTAKASHYPPEPFVLADEIILRP